MKAVLLMQAGVSVITEAGSSTGNKESFVLISRIGRKVVPTKLGLVLAIGIELAVVTGVKIVVVIGDKIALALGVEVMVLTAAELAFSTRACGGD
ncbi:unnamed protein product [Clavelina lepadiformis]|uniref:Uncharacterized protein n=1 Tax=Clavelina lepadiformis TaxID=159417 RepID=A0ABP0GW15_CLALP